MGFSGLSPWNRESHKYSIGQILLGITPLSKIEVVSIVNINNISRGWIYYDLADRTQKYYPKIYLGAQTSVAYTWNSEDGFTLSSWPEI